MCTLGTEKAKGPFHPRALLWCVEGAFQFAGVLVCTHLGVSHAEVPPERGREVRRRGALSKRGGLSRYALARGAHPSTSNLRFALRMLV